MYVYIYIYIKAQVNSQKHICLWIRILIGIGLKETLPLMTSLITISFEMDRTRIISVSDLYKKSSLVLVLV